MGRDVRGQPRPRPRPQVLDEDHYDLEKIKERILEYLAVRKLRGQKMKGPILCFVGPPGVGKTSLGRSIARALGPQVRAHLARRRARRGGDPRPSPHLRRRAARAASSRASTRPQTSNPVFMLDEIDKIGADYRGDPSSALLEVLDPEQNFSLPRSLPRRAVRPLERDVHRHGERARHRSSRRSSTAWRSSASPATRRRRS